MKINVSYNVLWSSRSSSISATGIIKVFRYDYERSNLTNPLLRNPYHCLFYNAIDGQPWEEDDCYIIDRNDPRWQRMVEHRYELGDNKVDLDEFPFVLNLGKYSGYLDIYPHYVFEDHELKDIIKKFEFYYNEQDELIVKTPSTESGTLVRFFNDAHFKEYIETSQRYSEYGWHDLPISKSTFIPDI